MESENKIHEIHSLLGNLRMSVLIYKLFDIINSVTENSEKIQSNHNKEFENLIKLLNALAGYSVSIEENKIILKKTLLKSYKFKIENIQYILSNKEKYYSEFSIKKKSGKLRKINAPISWLKALLKDITTLLYLLRVPNDNSFGFELQRSIVDNARLHIGKRVVLNIDLKDFFPNISYTQVKNVFMNEPFMLNEEIAELLANLTTLNGKLPQGASTSPVISNFVCNRLDKELIEFCKAHNITYSRYADDLTFSHTYNISYKQQDFIRKIVEGNSFIINNKKVRKQLPHQRQCVTGITINEKLNVRRKYINEVRAILDNWKKYGYVHALERYYDVYAIGFDKSLSLVKLLTGKINYIGIVKGKTDSIYLKLQKQLYELKQRDITLT